MTIYLKRSTDSGAPQLSSVAGSFIALLDYLLVTTLGWTKPYTGTNLAAYRQPSGTNQMYLRVDDTNASTTRVVAFETMSDVNTGTGQFPTTAQVSGGLYNEKNATNNYGWTFISDGKIFYLFWGMQVNSYFRSMAFGDFRSYKSGDAFNTVISANSGTTQGNAALVTFDTTLASVANTTTYAARSYTQSGTAIRLGVAGNLALLGSNDPSSGNMQIPSLTTGDVYVAELRLFESTAFRGYYPGLWMHMHRSSPYNQSVIKIGNRTLEAIWQTYSGGYYAMFIETSDTWGE